MNKSSSAARAKTIRHLLVGLLAGTVLSAAAQASPDSERAALPYWQTPLMDAGRKLFQEGKFEEGGKVFAEAADKGDDRAMVALGLYHQSGKYDFKQDYAKAHGYYVRALGPTPYPKMPGGFKPNGYALNNLGVMFRDGLGVPVNRQVANALFLFEYTANGYSQDSIGLASGNLNRDMREMSKSEVDAALCLNMAYVWAVVKGKGVAAPIEPSKDNPRIRDWGVWMKGELGDVKC
jgi:TPR repeat protein